MCMKSFNLREPSIWQPGCSLQQGEIRRAEQRTIAGRIARLLVTVGFESEV